MTNLHLPKSFEHFFETFRHTDPMAWIVFVMAVASMAAILTTFFSR
jgi:hypothetical protein